MISRRGSVLLQWIRGTITMDGVETAHRLARRSSASPGAKPDDIWGHTGAGMKQPKLPISGSSGNCFECLPGWRRASAVMSVIQMVFGFFLFIFSCTLARNNIRMGFFVASLLMIGLGLLGFLGAKKIAPRALWIQAIGSFIIVLLVFGGVNQVATNLEVDCAFGEVYLRVFHLEERLQAVKHDKMMSSMFLRLSQMDQMMDAIKDGAIAEFDIIARVDKIVSQDKLVIQNRLLQLKEHAQAVLTQLRASAMNSTDGLSHNNVEEEISAGSTVEQQILSAQFALESIERRLQKEGELTNHEYELLLEALISGNASEDANANLKKYAAESEDVKHAIGRQENGVIYDEEAHAAAIKSEAIKKNKEMDRHLFEEFFTKTMSSHKGLADGYNDDLESLLLQSLPGHCFTELQSFPIIRGIGWSVMSVQGVTLYVVSTLLLFVPGKYHKL